jgi:hypothetical protein
MKIVSAWLNWTVLILSFLIFVSGEVAFVYGLLKLFGQI